MGHRCKPCSHPNRGELDAMLARGVPLASIARRFGLSKDSLWRHRKGGHIPAEVATAHKAAMLRKGPHIDLERLRVEESEGLLLSLASQRAILLAAQDRAQDAEQYGNVAALGAQIHRNLQLVGQHLGEFAQHQTKVTHNLILAPEYLQLRAGIIEALRDHPEARRRVAEALRAIEGREVRWDGIKSPSPPLIEGNGHAGE